MQAELRRLSENGIREFPPSGFGPLVAACMSAASTSPRYAVVAEAMELLVDAWEPFEAFWVEWTDRLDEVLAVDLPGIVDEPDEEAAISLARSMREAVALVLASARPM